VLQSIVRNVGLETFRNKITVRLQDTDAAGILFFASQLIYAHETYEKFMEEIGCSFAEVFERGVYLMPIVHAEADFMRTVTVGDLLDVEMSVAAVGNSSYTLEYLLKAEDGTEIGRCRTVHVTISRSEKKKIPLPRPIRQGLERYRRRT
jgi:1,4-dihydroxy-2-naphthoyl-CoA hydrolase